MEKSSVNQQLIADRLNLSRTTVSRCFTNHPGINPETRSRVFKLAASLGYSYLEGRTGKKSDRRPLTHLGVLICTDPEGYADESFENPGSRLLSGVSEFAQLHRAQLDVHFVNPADLSLEADSYRGITPLQNREWDGVLLIYPFPQPVIDSLHVLFPLVSLVEQFTNTPLNCVDVNHHRGIELAIDHLVGLGHRRIGFLTQAYDLSAKWALRRYSAFLAETARRRLPVQPEDIIGPSLADQLTLEEVHGLATTRTRDGVTAWVCAADHQAYQFESHLLAQGFDVPNGVSLTGFDGITPPDWADPMTTIDIPYHEIGLTGGKRLNDLVQKRFDSAQDILVDCLLKPGTSTRSPS